MILNIRDIDVKCHFTLPKIGLPKIKTLTPPMSTCTLINRISVVSLWVSVLYSSYHIDYHLLILYEYVYREKQRLCDWENDI